MCKRIGLLLGLVFLLIGCAGQPVQEPEGSYEQISQEKAMKLMETETDYVILDVRTQEEFDQGHLPGAVLIPHDTINGEVSQLPDKEQLILVYCRSGNRSKQAAQALAKAGYTHVKEFGGINTWTGEVVVTGY